MFSLNRNSIWALIINATSKDMGHGELHMNGRDAAKYFVHGLAFSLLFLILVVAWAFILIILVSLGFLIGLIIGLGLLFLIVGGLNTFITSLLWFEVKKGFWDLLLHGVALFFILLIANAIIQFVPNLVVPGIATTVVTFLIAAFVDGLIAQKVARFWEEEYASEPVSEAVKAEWGDKQL